jgi:hypothetical protein
LQYSQLYACFNSEYVLYLCGYGGNGGADGIIGVAAEDDEGTENINLNILIFKLKQPLLGKGEYGGGGMDGLGRLGYVVNDSTMGDCGCC